MKVVAYCIDTNEKMLLAKANGKKHDITVISNALNLDTVGYADKKIAVIVCSKENIDTELFSAFTSLGVQLLITKFGVDVSTMENARFNYDIRIQPVTENWLPQKSSEAREAKEKQRNGLENVYEEIISVLDNWQQKAVRSDSK